MTPAASYCMESLPCSPYEEVLGGRGWCIAVVGSSVAEGRFELQKTSPEVVWIHFFLDVQVDTKKLNINMELNLPTWSKKSWWLLNYSRYKPIICIDVCLPPKFCAVFETKKKLEMVDLARPTNSWRFKTCQGTIPGANGAGHTSSERPCNFMGGFHSLGFRASSMAGKRHFSSSNGAKISCWEIAGQVWRVLANLINFFFASFEFEMRFLKSSWNDVDTEVREQTPQKKLESSWKSFKFLVLQHVGSKTLYFLMFAIHILLKLWSVRAPFRFRHDSAVSWTLAGSRPETWKLQRSMAMVSMVSLVSMAPASWILCFGDSHLHWEFNWSFPKL